jgi:hypothetical protein
LAAAELDVKGDVAAAVEPVNLRRPAVHADAGHMAQRHRAVAAGHGQARQRCQVSAHRIRQLDPDRHLPLRQVELGQAGVVIASGSDPHRLADGRSRHAEVGGARGVGPHNDFGPHQRSAGLHVAHALEAAQLSLHQLCCGQQRHRIFALQHQLHLDAGVGRADGEAGTGHVAEFAP